MSNSSSATPLSPEMPHLPHWDLQIDHMPLSVEFLEPPQFAGEAETVGNCGVNFVSALMRQGISIKKITFERRLTGGITAILWQMSITFLDEDGNDAVNETAIKIVPSAPKSTLDALGLNTEVRVFNSLLNDKYFDSPDVAVPRYLDWHIDGNMVEDGPARNTRLEEHIPGAMAASYVVMEFIPGQSVFMFDNVADRKIIYSYIADALMQLAKQGKYQLDLHKGNFIYDPQRLKQQQSPAVVIDIGGVYFVTPGMRGMRYQYTPKLYGISNEVATAVEAIRLMRRAFLNMLFFDVFNIPIGVIKHPSSAGNIGEMLYAVTTATKLERVVTRYAPVIESAVVDYVYSVTNNADASTRLANFVTQTLLREDGNLDLDEICRQFFDIMLPVRTVGSYDINFDSIVVPGREK